MIHQGCPNLEHLGVLNFCDTRVSDAVIHESGSDTTENLFLDYETALSGIFPNLNEMTFYIGRERDQGKILSAVMLGMTLAWSRGIYSKIVPWCQEDGTPYLIMEKLQDFMKIQELMEKQLDVSLDQFVSLWSEFINANMTFEAAVLPKIPSTSIFYTLSYLNPNQ